MTDKKLMFLAINMLITVFSLAIIIGTMFKKTAIFVAITILIVQKLVEIKVIEETRKVSIVILLIIIAAAGYFGYRLY